MYITAKLILNSLNWIIESVKTTPRFFIFKHDAQWLKVYRDRRLVFSFCKYWKSYAFVYYNCICINQFSKHTSHLSPVCIYGAKKDHSKENYKLEILRLNYNKI